jgi:hypothetical protein
MNPLRSPPAIDAGAARLLRSSIAFLWLSTAAVSIWEWHGQSTDLLVMAGIIDPAWRTGSIWLGAGVDGALGLAILAWPGRWTYLTALATMAAMTVVATILLPGLWLHPLGPLTKNIPIAATLWILSRAER